MLASQGGLCYIEMVSQYFCITRNLLLQAYFIGVVWNCYKYLSLRQVAAQRTIHYIDPDSQSLLPDLPDYETAVGDPHFAVKKFPTPPPSYASATAAAVEVAQAPTAIAVPPQPQPQAQPQPPTPPPPPRPPPPPPPGPATTQRPTAPPN
jgi:hypothetical protein